MAGPSSGNVVAVGSGFECDPFYRYKMPRLVVKAQGGGCGNKTVVENLQAVAKSLSRPPLRPSALFLGVMIDASVSWKPQVSRLVKRLSSAAFALSTLKNTCSMPVLLTAYTAYFESLLRYGVAFWGDSSTSDKVFKIQKHAIRIIFNLRKRDSCKNIFKEHNILTLPSLYIENLAVLTFQNIGQVQKTGSFHDMDTRHRDNINFPIHRTKALEKGPYYRGLKVFSKLPQSIKNQTSLKAFKHNLKTVPMI